MDQLNSETPSPLDQFHFLVEHASEQIALFSKDCRFQYVNAAFCKRHGYSREELMSMRAWDINIHGSSEEFEHLWNAVQDQESIRIEVQHCTKSGEIFDLEVTLKYFRFNGGEFLCGFAREITERKQAEIALRASEERLQAIIDNSRAAIFMKDMQGRYLLMNRECERLFHITDEGIRGKTDYDLFPQDIADALRENDRQVIEAGKALTLEEEVPLDDGIHTYIAVKFPLIDNAGIPYAICGISTDISDRVRLQAERDRILKREQSARAEAERANRIKDEFLAVLSHELRSPLNPILGWTKLLRTGRLDPAKTEEALATIERNAQLQSQLIEDLLDVSRIVRGKLALAVTTVSMATIIEAAIETVRLAAEAKQIQIRTVLDPMVRAVCGDASRLQQVIWNLLSNAVKFTPAGGCIEIRLTQVGNQAQIEVSDTGKGISPDFLPYVFEHFRQEDGSTTRKFGGLGLGLAIVRQIVELHGGTVRATSAGEHQGSTFIVTLPTLNQEPQGLSNPIESPLPEPVLPLAGIHALIVDDEPDTREFHAFVLEQEGAKVTVADSAIAALYQLDQFTPDILLSDIGMPDMNGYLLMQMIRLRPVEQGGQIPAIALTAYAGEFDQQKALSAGFQYHLAKPIDPDQLIQTIAALLERSGND